MFSLLSLLKATREGFRLREVPLSSLAKRRAQNKSRSRASSSSSEDERGDDANGENGDNKPPSARKKKLRKLAPLSIDGSVTDDKSTPPSAEMGKHGCTLVRIQLCGRGSGLSTYLTGYPALIIN